MKKRRKRGGGRGGRWKEEGRVGRKLGDGYYLLFKQEETKVKRKCLAQGSRVIRRRTRTESQLCVTAKLRLSQDIRFLGQTPLQPPNDSIRGKVWSEEPGHHGSSNKKHRERSPLRCPVNPTTPVIISTRLTSPCATDQVNPGWVT